MVELEWNDCLVTFRQCGVSLSRQSDMNVILMKQMSPWFLSRNKEYTTTTTATPPTWRPGLRIWLAVDPWVLVCVLGLYVRPSQSVQATTAVLCTLAPLDNWDLANILIWSNSSAASSRDWEYYQTIVPSTSDWRPGLDVSRECKMGSADCAVYRPTPTPCQLCLGPGPGNTTSSSTRRQNSHQVARFLHVWALEQVQVELDLIWRQLGGKR